MKAVLVAFSVFIVIVNTKSEQSVVVASAGGTGGPGGQSVLLLRNVCSRHLIVMRPLCTNVKLFCMWHVRGWSGDTTFGVEHWRVCDSTPRKFQPLLSRRSYWKRGKTVHFWMEHSRGTCTLSSTLKMGSHKVTQDAPSCQALSGWLIPCKDSTTSEYRAHFTPVQWPTASTVVDYITLKSS